MTRLTETVLALREEGLSYQAIADRLGESYSTVYYAGNIERSREYRRAYYRRNRPNVADMAERVWTKERALAAIHDFHDLNDRTPTHEELRHDPGLPTARALDRIFGKPGYYHALMEAGYEPRPVGRPRLAAA